MTNLLEETETILKEHNKRLVHINRVVAGNLEIGIENFIEVAKKTNYNAGYGSPKVATDLQIIGDDWWMTRDDYDGSEWWEWHQTPVLNTKFVKIEKLATNGVGWKTLAELNEEE